MNDRLQDADSTLSGLSAVFQKPGLRRHRFKQKHVLKRVTRTSREMKVPSYRRELEELVAKLVCFTKLSLKVIRVLSISK